MTGNPEPPSRAYLERVLSRPCTVLALLLLLLAFFAYHAQDFTLDASPDSLLLESDRDLQLLRQVNARYGSRELLIVTFTTTDLFSDDSLRLLQRLRDELRSLDSVDSASSILDVPLVKSSDMSLAGMADNVQTLESPTVDRQRAREELASSPVYQDLFISRDGQTTAILVSLRRDEDLWTLQNARNELLIQKGDGTLGPVGHRRLEDVSAAYAEARGSANHRRRATIRDIRAVIDRYREHGVLHLGGGPMIADDMLTFVRSDLRVFGFSVLLFVVLVLFLIFRRIRWVVLPLLSCFYASVVMIGMLGLIGWPVTVVSSNFLALMLIITISMNIHLAVRYRQLLQNRPDAPQIELVEGTIRKMVWPCLYTALTTIIGFGSLVLSDIKPVRDFGWMMSLGLTVAFATSFTLFPAVLLLLGKPRRADSSPSGFPLTGALASITERHGTAVLVCAGLLAVLSIVGISRLAVENSFIDYFRKSTEIYQGMKLIDEKLGGTTPLQVLLNFDPRPDTEELLPDEELDEWDLELANSPKYWFTPLQVDRIEEVHDYLEGLPEVGKVLSLTSLLRVAEELNDGEKLEGFELSLLYEKLPVEVREPLVDPYFSFEHNEARILLRILDSREGLRRRELLDRIRVDLRDRLGLE
ncbi:MAG: MMPL family transporter [Myxococcota bacterium]